jgi:hypothetical protein
MLEGVSARGVPAPRRAATASHKVAENRSDFKRFISFGSNCAEAGEPQSQRAKIRWCKTDTLATLAISGNMPS